MKKTDFKKYLSLLIVVFSVAAVGDVIFSPEKDLNTLFQVDESQQTIQMGKTHEEVKSFAAQIRKIESFVSQNPEFQGEYREVIRDLREAALKLEAIKAEVGSRNGPPGV